MKKLLLSGAILLASITGIHAQWIQQASNITAGYYVPFIDAVDDQVVWGIVADPLAQTNPVAEFTRTVDGGNLWISGSITNATGLAPSCIFGLNADTAWVAMWNVAGGSSPGRILKTEDGGGTWTHQATALFNTAGNFPNWVYFWDANNGICMGDPTGGYFEIYTTSDGGTNWVRTPDIDIAPEQTGEFGITDVFTHQGDSTLYFGTNMGRIYKTTDLGLHFTAAQTPFFDFIGAVAFRDANNGLCVSGGATGSTDVAYTTDGGSTWNLKGTNTVMNLILGMCYVPGTDSTFFISTPAAGSVDGTSYSPNDGSIWVPVDNLIHTDIEFVNDSTGWTGSNELGAPMMKWTTPVITPADDASSMSIDVTTNTGLVTQSPLATFRNSGLNAQSFDVTMTITGGYSSTKTTSNLAFFDTEQITFDPWTPAASGVYTITIYTQLAGDANNNNDTLTKTVNVFAAFENYGWTSMPPISTAAFGHGSAFNLNGTSASSPGTFYAMGGINATQGVTTNEAFFTPGLNWSTVASMLQGKYHFSAQKAGNKIYCTGGYFNIFVPDGIMLIYDLGSGAWSTGTPMPVPVGDYAAGVYGDSLIYYINGYDGTADQNIVQIYNTNTDSWLVGNPSPGNPTEGSRGGIVGDKILFLGGYSAVVFSTIADAWQGTIDAANPTNITWTALPPYPGGIVFRPSGGVVFEQLRPLIIFAGGSPSPVGSGAETMNDCWGYDFSLNQWLIGTAKTTSVNNVVDLPGTVYNDSLWMASIGGYDGLNYQTVNEWLNLGASPPLGITENDGASIDAIWIYPNPATDKLFVTIKDHADVTQLTVTDVAGRIVNITTVNKGIKVIKLTLADLDAGVYILNAIKENGNSGGYIKFVKD